MTEGRLQYDVASKRRTPLQRALGSRRTSLAVVAGLLAIAVIVLPLVVFVHRVIARQPAVHRLERLATDAQPAATHIIDSGIKDNEGSVGFAYGVSNLSQAELLAAKPPPSWQPGPALPESPDTRLYRDGRLILSIKVAPCKRLTQCRPGDELVYTEVQDIG